jgi:N-methylhydantoinase A
MTDEAGILLGVDIGGTFTDLMLFNPRTQATRFMKVLTTTDDLSRGVLEGVNMIAGAEGAKTSDISSAIHGSTIGVNTIIERKGARTGLITTKGFEDILFIARQTRPKIYDWRIGRPTPLVPGLLRRGVRERVSYTGEIIEPLDENDVRETAKYLMKHDVESFAVCLLHSYANPSHEERVGEILEEAVPDAYVSISSSLLPEFREYERMSTTVANAYIGPVVSKYISRLQGALEEIGIKLLMIMQANGGLMTTKDAQSQPIRTIESGPAGGVIAAAYIGRLVGRTNLISFDMGGTTAKSCLIADSKPTVTTEYEVSPYEHGEQLIKGTGYPIKTPAIDLVEVGAGGGSIAWVDRGGALRVGPQSAGADPGPACYGRGGVEPTITDANVVLGRINPDYFLGGEMTLDARASERVVERLAEKVGLGLIDTAEGILRVANSTMARSIRYVSTERGYDPRDFSLVAFGGAAPVQIVDLARMVGVNEIVVPPSPGVFSAFGFLMADLAHHYVRTKLLRRGDTSATILESTFKELEEIGGAQLNEDMVPAEDRLMLRSVDIRYIGQSHELNVSIPEEIGDGDLEGIIEQFHRIHEMHYGYAMRDEEVVFINFRLAATGIRSKPERRPIQTMGMGSGETLKGFRRVHFRDSGWVECGVYDRGCLNPGKVIRGPCVVEEWDSTTVVNDGFQARVDSFGNIFIAEGGG